MKNSILKNIIALGVCMVLAQFANSQSVGINTTSPDSSAALHITSAAKGILIPRMSTSQRNAIYNPAKGLLVYDSTLASFWTYNGTAWESIQSSYFTLIRDTDNNTKVETENTSNENKIRFTLNDTNYFTMNRHTLEFNNAGNSVYIGNNSGSGDTLSNANTYNVAVGTNALQNGTGGISNGFNTAVGTNAMQNIKYNVRSNTAIGYQALNQLDSSAVGNIAVGSNSQYFRTKGLGNVSLGSATGYYNTSGNYNVFLGNTAGFYETGSNKLYIENSMSTTPLIYGDFSTNKVTINDSLSSKYFSMTDGANNGYVLQCDSNGNGTWVTPSTFLTWTASGNNIYKNNSGNVGIGTSSPSKLLDVNGDASINSLTVGHGNNNLSSNTALGYANLANVTTGNDNTATGYYALAGTTSGFQNAAFGTYALNNNATGAANAAIGKSALRYNTSGSDNTAIGQGSLVSNNSGNANTAIGSEAGYNATGSGNVLIGRSAGYDETGDNKLYISNSGTTTPLIYGDFSTNKVTINDSLSSKYFSMTDGATNGYVLQCDSNGNGTWVNSSVLTPSLIKDADANTKIEVEQSSNENKIHMTMNDTEYYVFDKGHIYVKNTNQSVYIGEDAGLNDYNGVNTFIGYKAGMNNGFGSSNTYVGKLAGNKNEWGESNTALGDEALNYNQSGSYNVAIGRASQATATNATNNVSVGSFTLSQVTTGGSNVCVGNTALGSVTDGEQNTAIGNKAGANTTGSRNVFVGYNAGYNETGNDKLYIANSNTTSPLIYGDFSTNHVTINDSLTSKYFQMSNGATNGYVLQTDSIGNATWVSPYSAASSLIKDADANTKIEVEQSTNEDYIHFSMAGKEYFTMKKATLEVNNSGKCVYLGTAAGTNDQYTHSSNVNNENTGIGANNLQTVTTGYQNTSVGGHSSQNLTTGTGNSTLGYYAGQKITTGTDNVALGIFALSNVTTGSTNVGIGNAAGGSLTTGGGNVFMGYHAGSNETGSNKLYIDNSSTSTPLIYGDFSNNHLTINDSLTSKYIQFTNGATNGYVLQSDASGNGTWVNASSLTFSGISSGIVKSTSGVLSAATSGTDYQAPMSAGTGVSISSNTINTKWTTSGNNIYSNNTSNVGIGTTSPGEKLHIVGNAKIDAGSIEVSNTGNSIYFGDHAGNSDNFASNLRNVGIGSYTLTSDTSGAGNIGIGHLALEYNTNGSSNVAIGLQAMINNTSGNFNCAIGQSALGSNTTGIYNSAFGGQAFVNNKTGNYNTALGMQALYSDTSGSNNISIGYNSGHDNKNGSGNIFLGYEAGYSETGSNKLYIDNNSTSTPLIYGDFSSDKIGIANSSPTSTLSISGSLSVSTAAKTASYTLSSTDYCVIFTGSTTSQTFTLPSASGCTGRVYLIVNQSTVSLSTSTYQSGSGGGNTTSVSAGASVQIVSDGSNWRKIN